MWESSSGVKNRLAAEHPGKQGNEWLQIFFIERMHNLVFIEFYVNYSGIGSKQVVNIS